MSVTISVLYCEICKRVESKEEENVLENSQERDRNDEIGEINLAFTPFLNCVLHSD